MTTPPNPPPPKAPTTDAAPDATPATPTFTTILHRDLTITYRRRAELLHPLIFFVIAASLFPLALSPDPAALAEIAPAVLWVAALLAALLALPGVFGGDYADGWLEQMLCCRRHHQAY